MQPIRLNAIAEGTEFDGYRFDGILGAGGFGITYRATELLLGRSVAIKEYFPGGLAMRDGDGMSVVPVGQSETETFEWGMERFRSEAQTLVAFRHPNIVTVFRYFETNSTGYLVMEFVEGRTLKQLLHPEDHLTEPEIHSILDPILDGVRAVHGGGFLHRDIKPDNIFIRRDGSPVLIDFGAARQAFGQHSKSLTAIISEGYAPYEQYDSSGDQGPWSDIYALGGVLYRCMTGRRPPDAPSRVAALVRAIDDPMPRLVSVQREKYSADLIEAVEQALSVREDGRPQTIEAFEYLIRRRHRDDPTEHAPATARSRTKPLDTGTSAKPPEAGSAPPAKQDKTVSDRLAIGSAETVVLPVDIAAPDPAPDRLTCPPRDPAAQPAPVKVSVAPPPRRSTSRDPLFGRIVRISVLIAILYTALYPLGALVFASMNGLTPSDGIQITELYFFDHGWITLNLLTIPALSVGQYFIMLPGGDPHAPDAVARPFWSKKFLFLMLVSNLLAPVLLLLMYRMPSAVETPTFLYASLGSSTLIFVVLAFFIFASARMGQRRNADN